jgi:hypothetical protein
LHAPRLDSQFLDAIHRPPGRYRLRT